MIKRISILSIFLLLMSVSGFSDQIEEKVKIFNKVVENNLVFFGKNIVVNGNVEKSLIKIGGSLKLNGSVNKDVVCISSKVELGSNCTIGGDLIVIGGSLKGKNKNNIKGDIHNINFSFKKIDTSLTNINFNSKTINLLKTLFLILSLIVSLILFGITPIKIKKAEELLCDNFLRIGSLGILSVLSFVILFLISVVLSFMYIGIPILMILLILLICILIFGRTVMYYSIGQKIISKFNLSVFSPAAYILTGVGVYLILNYIPVAGFIILKVLTIFEIGIGVGFIFRKKLNLKSLSEFVAEYGNE